MSPRWSNLPYQQAANWMGNLLPMINPETADARFFLIGDMPKAKLRNRGWPANPGLVQWLVDDIFSLARTSSGVQVSHIRLAGYCWPTVCFCGSEVRSIVSETFMLVFVPAAWFQTLDYLASLSETTRARVWPWVLSLHSSGARPMRSRSVFAAINALPDCNLRHRSRSVHNYFTEGCTAYGVAWTTSYTVSTYFESKGML